MNKLETAFHLAKVEEEHHSALNNTLDRALGYEVIFTILTERYHGTNTMYIWKSGEDIQSAAKYLSYKNGNHWDEFGTFTREELNTIDEVMGS